MTRRRPASGTARRARSTRGRAALAPAVPIETCIRVVRSQRVMLDSDLAAFYGVATRVLNQAIRRNRPRFPADFVFQLSQSDARILRSQIVTSKSDCGAAASMGHGGRRYLPYAFTEHGVLMAAAVLNSPRAHQVSILIIRAFVRLRQLLISHADLARRLEALEREFVRKTGAHEEHIRRIYEMLDELMNPPPPEPEPEPPPREPIGFGGLLEKRAAPRSLRSHR